MLFNSWTYVLLILCLLPVYYGLRGGRSQTLWLILGSFVFYAYGQPHLLALLVFSASLNAVTSFRVEHAAGLSEKRIWAVTGVVVNLLVLGFFKYAGFLAASIEALTSHGFQPGHWLVTLPLPVGISFYTFQGISLVVDLFRYDEAERRAVFGEANQVRFGAHFRKTVFFVCFFPQLVAGPIVKAHEFFPQIGHKHLRDVPWESAFRALILGYFLKMGIADNLNAQTFWIAYPYFLNFSSIDLLVLLFGFSMQIFADFAGYSLIAIGTARLFGYQLPINFNFPYIARSFSEFWRRWHISLSSWLRDYLYIPLGGNRKGAGRTYFHLFVVMFLGGLWHGAAWSYAVWGTWHGVALALERPCRRFSRHFAESRIWNLFTMGFVFLFVTLSWLLFQLPEFGEAVRYLQAIGQNTAIHIRVDRVLVILLYSLPVILYHLNGWSREQQKPHLSAVASAKEDLPPVRHCLGEGGSPISHIPSSISHLPYPISQLLYNLAYGGMLFWILFNSGSSEAFIYFQF